METAINFGGFYQGIHQFTIDSLIESEIEYLVDSYAQEDKEFIIDEYYDSINYKQLYLDYARYYTKQFFKFLKDCWGVTITSKEKNIIVQSPKEYNFRTDIIILSNVSKYSQSNMKRLFNILLDCEKGFKDYIKYLTSSSDGYIPYYTYQQIVELEEPDMSYQMALSYMSNEYNNSEFDISDISEHLRLYSLY